MSLNEKNIVNKLDYEESTSEEEDVEVKKGKKEEQELVWNLGGWQVDKKQIV